MTTLKFNKNVLLDALYKTSIVIPAKPLVAYAEFVRIQTVGDHALLSATDMGGQDMCITVPCTFSDKADFSLSHKDLWAYVKTVDSEELTFVIEEKTCTIKHGDETSSFTIGDGEVIIRACDVEGKIFVRSEDVDAIYNGAKNFIDLNEVRDCLKGLMVIVHKKKAELYAADNVTAHKFSIPFDDEDRSFILPLAFLRAMHVLNSETMYIGVDANHCWLESAGAKYHTSLINYEVPNWKAFFAQMKNNKTTATFKVTDLVNVIKKVLIFDDTIRMEFKKDSMRIYANNDAFGKKFSTFIPCVNNAPEDVVFGFGCKYLSKILSNLDGDVTMLIHSPKTPVFFDVEDEIYSLALVSI